MSRRLLGIAAITAGVLAGSWWIYSTLIRPRETAAVFYGNIDIREVDLGFRVSGRIGAMNFDEGDDVKQGDVLAVLDKQPFMNEVSLQAANVAQQEANVAKLQAGNRVEEIAQARADLASRKSTLENARGVFQRQNELQKKEFASKQTFEDAAASLRDAEAKVRSSEEALKLSLAGSRVEDIAAGAAALEAARAQRDVAQTSLADTELKAPTDGVILTRAVEPGAIVASSTTVYTLSLRNPVWVRAYVSEAQLGLLRPGLAVKLYTDTRPDAPYDGQVGFISPVAEFTPKSVETTQLRADLVYRFRVIVKTVDDALRQGMPVTIKIPESEGAPPAIASGS